MKNSAIIVSAIAVMILGGAFVSAQEQSKGIDTQTQQIKDISTQRGPTDNGNKQNVGTGRGIDFDKGKTVERLPLANPFRMASRRDVLIASVADIMREQNLVVDEAASRPNEGVLISQPFTFVKGGIISRSEISRFANLPDRTDDAFSRGRYTLTVEVQTIDGINNNVSVTAKVEARSESAQGSSWLTLSSSGEAENDFLEALVERVTGVAPYSAPPAEADTKDEKRNEPRAPKPAAKPKTD